MRTLTKLATAFLVALPLIGAGVGSAQARESVTFGVTVGTPNYAPAYYGHRDRRHDTLPPGLIRDRLSRTYYEVSPPDRRGDVYVARAEDRRGRDLRITVDAYTGEVIDVSYTRRDRDHGDDRRDRWHGRD